MALTRFCISGFERWIAFNSIPELKAPVSAEETGTTHSDSIIFST
jgi:hypothetical protein